MDSSTLDLLDAVRMIAWRQEVGSDELSYLSPSAASILGGKFEDWLSVSHWAEKVHPDDRAEFMDCRRPQKGDEPLQLFEFRIDDGHQGWTWLHERLLTVLDESGEVKSVSGICSVITEQKEREEVLVEREARFEALLGSMPVIIWSTGVDLKLKYLLGGGLQFQNTDADSALGASLEVLLMSDMVARVGGLSPIEGHRNALEGVSADYEIKYGERSYDAHVEPLKKVDGTVIGTMGIARDITDLVKVREQFFFAQKMEAVGRLAGGVAHDINNLLTAIMGYADILKKGVGEDDPLLRHVEAIGRASQRGEVMISQLMAYGRRRVSRPVDTDIGHWLESIEDFLARLVRDDIVLSVEGESGKHVACVDVVQLEQVILNLAVNAVDVMPNGGRLALGIRGVDVGAQEMDAYRVSAVGPYVCIEVSDDGGGIPEEIQGQIFEPFFTTKGVAEGTGLGLSTAFAIVHETGGGVSFETEQGVGTTFRVCLPQASAFTESAVKEGESVPMVPVGQARNILLVEDDEMVRVMVKDVLSNAGFKVMEAHYGPAALALSRQWGGSIDLLVTDVVMPRLSGPELASTLREEYPGLKVLFMSGHTGEAVEGELEDGMAFIAKPFHPDAFLGEVNGLLQPALSTVNVEKED